MYEFLAIIGWVVAVVCVVSGVVVLWGLKDDADSKPDGEVTSGPKCYGDYPLYDPDKMTERECRTCIYKRQCFSRTWNARA